MAAKVPGDGPVTVISGWRCRGQPVFRQWAENKRRVYWFTREVERISEHAWKLKSYVTLGTTKLDHRLTHAQRAAQLDGVEKAVLRMPGVRLQH